MPKTTYADYNRLRDLRDDIFTVLSIGESAIQTTAIASNVEMLREQYNALANVVEDLKVQFEDQIREEDQYLGQNGYDDVEDDNAI